MPAVGSAVHLDSEAGVVREPSVDEGLRKAHPRLVLRVRGG